MGPCMDREGRPSSGRESFAAQKKMRHSPQPRQQHSAAVVALEAGRQAICADRWDLLTPAPNPKPEPRR